MLAFLFVASLVVNAALLVLYKSKKRSVRILSERSTHQYRQLARWRAVHAHMRNAAYNQQLGNVEYMQTIKSATDAASEGDEYGFTELIKTLNELNEEARKCKR
ncbi:hypothetical protein SM033_00071 [Vibrio phage vB_VpaM_sm033]|nr:hypothetical protein SM033_00071 [Vibrio phage vB_VpaM_sm033]